MMPKYRNKLLLLTILVILFLPGCIGLKNLEVGTSINPDCSGKRVISIALDRQIAVLIEKESRTRLETYLQKKLPKNTSIKKYQKNNTVYYNISIPFKRIDDAPRLFNILLKNNEKPEISLTKKDYIFAISYDLKEELDLRKGIFDNILPKVLGNYVDSLEIEYWTKVPGEIGETSGTPVTADKAIWKIKIGKTYKIRTKSLLIRWWLVALTGIGLLIIIGFLGATLIKVKSRREQVQAE